MVRGFLFSRYGEFGDGVVVGSNLSVVVKIDSCLLSLLWTREEKRIGLRCLLLVCPATQILFIAARHGVHARKTINSLHQKISSQ